MKRTLDLFLYGGINYRVSSIGTMHLIHNNPFSSIGTHIGNSKRSPKMMSEIGFKNYRYSYLSPKSTILKIGRVG